MINHNSNIPDYDVAARRGGIVATAIYLLVLFFALWFTQCDTSPTEVEELTQGSILISFGDNQDGGGEVESVEQVVEPVPEPEPEIPVVDEPVESVVTPTDDSNDVVEIPEPPREVNKRALFPGAVSKKPNESSGASEPRGVAGSDRGSEKASNSSLGGGLSGDFDLAGRTLMGSLPVPSYGAQEEGRVVINITVDDSGRVTSASLRATSSTTNNSILIDAARRAALEARFSPSESFVQSGTITYIFKLN